VDKVIFGGSIKDGEWAKVNPLNDTSSIEREYQRLMFELDWLEKLPLKKRREYLNLVEAKRGILGRVKLEKSLNERMKKKNGNE